MKYLSLLLIALLATSCYSTHQTTKAVRDFNEDIIYKINQVQEGKSISMGNGSWNASRGFKFVFVLKTFANKTAEKQDLNFDNILLLDMDNRTKYKPEFSMVTGPVNLWGKIDSFIKPNDVKSRKIVFLLPKDMKPEYLMVNGNVAQIDYK